MLEGGQGRGGSDYVDLEFRPNTRKIELHISIRHPCLCTSRIFLAQYILMKPCSLPEYTISSYRQE